MKKLRKKLLIITLVCIMGFGTVVNAQTTYFDITVTRSGQGQDPISLRTQKYNDGDKYFYITPTERTGSGIVFVNSVNLYNRSIQSSTHFMDIGTLNKTSTYYYGKSVPGNDYYYLSCRYGLSNSNLIRVKGRYTP